MACIETVIKVVSNNNLDRSLKEFESSLDNYVKRGWRLVSVVPIGGTFPVSNKPCTTLVAYLEYSNG